MGFKDSIFRQILQILPEYDFEKTVDKKRSHKLKFKIPLYSVGATSLDLRLTMYDWAHFRKKKGEIKLHVKLDHSGYISSFIMQTS